jgi:hypothetical protein
MEIKLVLDDSSMPLAQLETLIQILAHQKATISLLCDKHSKTVEESDRLYRDVMGESDEQYKKIYEDLFARHSKINPDDLLPPK